jgi:hypothetical protein
LLAAVATVLRHKSVLRECQICYARNIDMLIVAAVARKLAGSEALLVYEVLDIQRIFLGRALVNRLARWVERSLLRSCDLLVVSSPDFVDRYFVPYQKLSTPWRLLENKVAAGARPAGGEKRAGLAALACPPWVIGWFGILRCVRSLNLLCGLADALGDRVQIYMRGRPSEEDLRMDIIEAATRRHPNVVFGGPYANPGDLPELYGRVHFSWAVDYLDAGTNPDWLLPNRIYEGGLYGSLALARKGTATSRLIESKGLGWTFDEPLGASVAEFLSKLDIDTYERARNSVAALNSSMFVDETDTRDLLEHLDALARARPSRGTASMRSTPEGPLA